jgi:hypothetical protein
MYLVIHSEFQRSDVLNKSTVNDSEGEQTVALIKESQHHAHRVVLIFVGFIGHTIGHGGVDCGS